MLFSKNLLAVASFVGAVSAQAAGKLRIMPLGDSITEITCWRAYVWDDIAAAGYASKVQYVGSQNSNPQNCKPKTTGWDQHHEGHSGWLGINIANNYLTNWLSKTPADIVMFMLGTNDVAQGHSATDIIASYTKMVGEMRASNPKMKIIVDTVLPLAGNAVITQVNSQIPTWAKGLNSTDSPIYIADCNQGFTTSMLRDGVHPNEAGDRAMQAKISPVLLQLIKDSLGSSTTAKRFVA